MDFQSLFLSPQGRIGRETFWIGFLILCAADVVLMMIPFLGHLALLASIYCWICLYAKRLHDMGKPAALIAIPYGAWLVPIAVAVIMGGVALVSGLLTSDNSVSAAALASIGGFFFACGAAFLVGVAFLLWMGLSPSQPGDNRYGSPPHAHPAAPPPPAPPAPPPSAPPNEPPAT
jgi:uncharacterized membrane protein YhaH (DUF805 family)